MTERDYDPGTRNELLRDTKGNPITTDYVDRIAVEAEIGYDLERLPPAKAGRPSLSQTGSSPTVRFRVSETTRDEAAAVAKREGKSISQLAREALESYLSTRRYA